MFLVNPFSYLQYILFASSFPFHSIFSLRFRCLIDFLLIKFQHQFDIFFFCFRFSLFVNTRFVFIFCVHDVLNWDFPSFSSSFFLQTRSNSILVSHIKLLCLWNKKLELFWNSIWNRSHRFLNRYKIIIKKKNYSLCVHRARFLLFQTDQMES